MTRMATLFVALAVALASSAAPSAQLMSVQKGQKARQGESLRAMKAPSNQNVKQSKELQLNKAKTWTRGQSQFAPLSVRPVLPRTSMVGAPAYAVAAKDICGCMIYSEDWDGEAQYGIYSLPTQAPAYIDEVMIAEELNANGGGTLAGNEYVFTNYIEFWGMIFMSSYVYDVDSWELVRSSEYGSYSAIATDMAYDATTDNIYGCFYNEDLDGYHFGILDTEYFESSVIAPIEQYYSAVAVNKEGRVFAINPAGDLMEIDKYTGAETLIGNTGLENAYTTSGVIDPASGVLYYMPNFRDGSVALYAIDTATAEATYLYDVPGNAEMTGLYIPAPSAEENAPAAVTNLAALFEDGSLSGKVTFDMPATLYDGSEPVEGQTLGYTVTANGAEVASGQGVAYGAKVEADVTVPEDGTYTFIVKATNEVGDGPVAKLNMYVGFDEPSVVENVEAAWADGVMTITWDPVDTTVHDGFLGNVTYTVLSNDEVLAEALAECTYTVDVPEPAQLTVYQYQVIAVAEGLKSVAAMSNAVVLGVIEPPFVEKFDTDGALSAWTIVDANGDDRTFVYNTDGHMRAQYSAAGTQMDDWLITPAVKLESEKYYEFYFDVASYSSYFAERYEVAVGTAPTAEAMTTILIEPTDVTNVDYAVARAGFMPEAAGEYYFGIHCISDGDQFYLVVDNVAISAAKSTAAPAAPTITVEPSITGEPSATINVTAPSQAISGAALSSLTDMIVMCGDQTIAVFDNPTPGETYATEYTAEDKGQVMFYAVANNADGEGIMAQRPAYLGLNTPAAPEWAAVEEVSDGVVKITWAPVAQDVDGNPMNPAVIKYVITSYEGVIAEDVDGTEYEYEAVAAGEQEFVQYAVYATTVEELSKTAALTGVIPVGTPFDLPFVETINNGELNYPWGVEDILYSCSWGIATDDTFADDNILSANGDDGFLYMNASYIDSESQLQSGKINVDMDDPVLSYYWYAIDEDDANTVVVYVEPQGQQMQEVARHTCEGTPGWHRTVVDMSQYTDQVVRLMFDVTVVNYTYAMLDDIRLETPFDYDLAAGALKAPAKVNAGTELTIGYVVNNLGLNAAEGYSVSLYCDGNLVETAEELPALESQAAYHGEFAHAFSALDAGTHTFMYNVNYAGDEDLTNNASRVATVEVKANKFPTVELTGAYDDETNGVLLSWTAPELDAQPVEILEDFESEDYPAFTIESFGPWTLRNYNESVTYGFSGLTFPNNYEPYGFILFDPALAGLTETITGYGDDGNFMAAFAHETDANDAWLISSELPGIAQTVTFMARSFNTQYGLETIKAYYSTTDNARESFVELEIGNYDGGCPAEWTQYSLELPEGAKYFAIQSTATDVFILLIDDISYIGYSAFGNLNVLGYNIYRDGEKINSELVTGLSYVDTEASSGSYVVTVVYEQGESSPSNQVEVNTQGIGALKSGSMISVVGRTIVVKDAANVTISAADGKVMRSAAGERKVEANVAPGVYVVKTNDKTVKVSVK